MEYMFLGMTFLINLASAFWVAHVGVCRGVKYSHAFWATFLLGPMVGLLYVLVKIQGPKCKDDCDC